MNDSKARLLELLCDETLFGLTGTEAMELDELKKEFPDWENDISLELAAAAVSLSAVEEKNEMPVTLREKIFANAEQFFDSNQDSQKSFAFASGAAGNINSPVGTTAKVDTVSADPQSSFWQWLGWAVAAAACVALAANIWLTRFQKPAETVKIPETFQTPTPPTQIMTAAQERDQLLASANDLVQIQFTNPKNPGEIIGDAVWSNSLQKGFVRFRGLPANDAAKESYQLWIVDETQNEKTPLSGGVFDSSGANETIVPIHAQLHVNKPKSVAVTMEKAGGVVVSKQERVIAMAKI